MVFTDVVIICKHQAQYDDENNKYAISFYNVDDGHFWFTACISTDLYDHHIAKLDTKPRHVLLTGNLIDVPIMQDYAGLVFESRQRIDVIQMKALNSDIYVPSTLVEQLGPTLVPYQFTPGPVEGYYLIVMNEQEKPVFHSINQDRPDDDFDGFDEEEFKSQDCEFDRNMAEQENTPHEYQDEFEAYQGILASEFDINFSKIMESEAGPSKSQSKSPMKSKSPATTKSAANVSSASKPAAIFPSLPSSPRELSDTEYPPPVLTASKHKSKKKKLPQALASISSTSSATTTTTKATAEQLKSIKKGKGKITTDDNKSTSTSSSLQLASKIVVAEQELESSATASLIIEQGNAFKTLKRVRSSDSESKKRAKEQRIFNDYVKKHRQHSK